MSEAEHLSEALSGLLTNPANGWYTPVSVSVKGLTAAQAIQVPAVGFNSVWGVVNHLRFWHECILLRLRGLPADREQLGAQNGWPPPPPEPDETYWQAACARLFSANQELTAWVAGLSNESLNEPYAPGRACPWQVVQGLIAHTGYHSCEIISIRHMLGLWLERT